MKECDRERYQKINQWFAGLSKSLEKSGHLVDGKLVGLEPPSLAPVIEEFFNAETRDLSANRYIG